MKTKHIFPLCWRHLVALAIMAARSVAAAQPAPPADNVPANPFGPKADIYAPPPAAPATTAPAPPKPAPATEDYLAPLRQMLLDRFDKNKTGTLSVAEIGEARAFLNGETSPTAGRVILPPTANGGILFGLRPLFLRRFDKNGDGVLDATELAAAKAFFLAGQNPPAPKPADLDALRQEIYQHFSAKGDATLTPEERAAAKAWLQQMIADLDKVPDAKPADSAAK